MADIEEKPRDDEVTLTPMEQFREDIKSMITEYDAEISVSGLTVRIISRSANICFLLRSNHMT